MAGRRQPAQLLAGGQEAVDDGPQEGRPGEQGLLGGEGGDGVGLDEGEPVGVAGELGAEQDAGGDLADDAGDEGAERGGGVVWFWCVSFGWGEEEAEKRE